MSQDAEPLRSASPRTEPARPYIGGQAVPEGVMMRAPKSLAIVVRRRSGALVVRERAMSDTPRGANKIPLVRGVASLVEALRLGAEAMKFSFGHLEEDLLAEEREEAEKKAKAASSATHLLSMLGAWLTAFGVTLFTMITTGGDEPAMSASTSGASPSASKDAGAADDGKRGGLTGMMLVVTLVFVIALPQAAAAGVNRIFHLGLDVQAPLFQVLTGIFKLTVVIGYMLAIRRAELIRRMFQYHGAEHKTISTYEANEALTVENARKKTTLHPRCGTTFLVMVAIVSILVFTGIGSFLPRIHTGSEILDNVIFFFEKLPFLPFIAGITFEIQRIFARYFTKGPLRVVLWPGFLVQKITTIEPDDAQLEVALASLRVTLFRQEGGESGAGDDDVTFSSFAAVLEAPHLRDASAPAAAA